MAATHPVAETGVSTATSKFTAESWRGAGRILMSAKPSIAARKRTSSEVREVPLADKLARMAVPSALAPALEDVARAPICSSLVAACCGR